MSIKLLQEGLNSIFGPKIMCVCFFIPTQINFIPILPLQNLLSGHRASETQKLATNILIKNYLIASPPRPYHPYISAVPKI